MTGHWHRHPGVRTGDQLTLGERAADGMRGVMGSWPFIFGFIATMVAWAGLNSLLLSSSAFDKYPYILLNLFLSMMAGLQGAVLLIAAKRADTISSELAVHDYQTNVDAKQIIDAVHGLTQEIHAATVHPPEGVTP